MSNKNNLPSLFLATKFNKKKLNDNLAKIKNRAAPSILPPIPVRVKHQSQGTAAKKRTLKNDWPEAKLNQEKLNENLAKIKNRAVALSIGKGIKTKKKKKN